ncbi:MAG: hypothetical protein IKS74_03805, partial [Methanomicrobium sp.]|nr:hypothetical protein [Methanomicrobium sp.]
MYSFEWVDAVASVFQLISLVGKLSGVLMRYVIRVGPDVFISMGAEVGRWGYLRYNPALVFPVAASALFSYLFVMIRLPFCRITAFMFPMQTAVSVFVGRLHCSVRMCSGVMVSDDILSSPDIVKSTMLFSFQKISKIHQNVSVGQSKNCRLFLFLTSIRLYFQGTLFSAKNHHKPYVGL